MHHGNHREPHRQRGPFWTPITPQTGSFFHAETHQKGETDLAIKDVVLCGRRYVLARNPEQARKDAETRTALLAGLERKLTQGDKALVGNAGYRFLAEPAGEGFTIDAVSMPVEISPLVPVENSPFRYVASLC